MEFLFNISPSYTFLFNIQYMRNNPKVIEIEYYKDQRNDISKHDIVNADIY